MPKIFADAPESHHDDPNDVRTTFLFTEPSVYSGVGRIFDLWGGSDLYNYSRTPLEADLRALYADWRITGQDVREVLMSLSYTPPRFHIIKHQSIESILRRRRQQNNVSCVGIRGSKQK